MMADAEGTLAISRFRISCGGPLWGVGFRVQGIGFRVCDLGLGFKVSGGDPVQLRAPRWL